MLKPASNRFFLLKAKKKSLFLSVAVLVCVLAALYQALYYKTLPSLAASTHGYIISGTVFNDVNENGVQDSGEVGVDGIVVKAYSDAGSMVTSDTTKTTSNKSGLYSLNIPASTGPVRMEFSNFGPSSTLGNLKKFQPSRHNGNAGTAIVFVDGKQANNTINFGIETPDEVCQAGTNGQVHAGRLTDNVNCNASLIEIGHRVWLDSNNNGIQDPSEPAIPGVTVHLYDKQGQSLLATAVTDANGEYYFTVAPNTTYILKLDNPADYTSGPLKGHRLTVANSDGCAHDIDSKASLPVPSSPIGSGNYPQMGVGPHAPGHNADTFDAGFVMSTTKDANQGGELNPDWAKCPPNKPKETPTPEVHHKPTPTPHPPETPTPTPSLPGLPPTGSQPYATW